MPLTCALTLFVPLLFKEDAGHDFSALQLVQPPKAWRIIGAWITDSTLTLTGGRLRNIGQVPGDHFVMHGNTLSWHFGKRQRNSDPWRFLLDLTRYFEVPLVETCKMFPRRVLGLGGWSLK